jgi:hypothetical protein
MTLQVPFIRFLRGHDFFPRLPAQSLRRRQIRMAARRDILSGPLGYRNASDEEQGTESRGENSSSVHGPDYRSCRWFLQVVHWSLTENFENAASRAGVNSMSGAWGDGQASNLQICQTIVE